MSSAVWLCSEQQRGHARVWLSRSSHGCLGSQCQAGGIAHSGVEFLMFLRLGESPQLPASPEAAVAVQDTHPALVTSCPVPLRVAQSDILCSVLRPDSPAHCHREKEPGFGEAAGGEWS